MRKNRQDKWSNRQFPKVQDEEHHIHPGSREGQRGKNIKIVPSDFHCAYHKLFINMTPNEVQRYLSEVWFTYKVFVSPQDWLDNEKRFK